MAVKAEVPPDLAGRRLDEVLAALAGVSRAVAARHVAADLVRVDGDAVRKAVRPAAGATVSWEPFSEGLDPGRPEAEALPLAVRHEDDHLLVVAKAAGVVVHPAPGHSGGTLVNALLGHLGAAGLSTAAGPGRPGIVHRLDKDTSGLLLVAKDDATHAALARALAARRIDRRYLALAQGHLKSDLGTIDAPVRRHPKDRRRMTVAEGGRSAVTHWTVLERLSGSTLLEARLETGRTHQIRVHLAHARHPLAGDRAYGADPRFAAAIGLERPFLHAWRLAFEHPVTGEPLDLTEPLPADLQAVLGRLGGEAPVPA